MVTPSPTFLLYRREALVLGAELHQIATSAETGFALPVDDLIVCARTNEAKLIALCAPNNPTGTVYSGDDLRRIADEAGALLVIDEAYREFCDQDLRPLLDEFENVILLRTFSKAYALAGLRIGYALAAPPLITAMDNVSPPFPITVFSAIAAEVALEHAPRFQKQVERVVAERERLAGAMRTLPSVTVFPSGTNFLLAHFDRPPDSIVRALIEERNLLISDAGGYPELTNCLRISVGTPEENDWVLAAVRDFVDGRVDA
jgi:histidinol-phosphate aminotransferase